CVQYFVVCRKRDTRSLDYAARRKTRRAAALEMTVFWSAIINPFATLSSRDLHRNLSSQDLHHNLSSRAKHDSSVARIMSSRGTLCFRVGQKRRYRLKYRFND